MNVTIAKAFQLPAAPELTATLVGSNVLVSYDPSLCRRDGIAMPQTGAARNS